MEKKYFTVRIDKQMWTNETITLDEIVARGFSVQEARRDGDYDVFYKGKKVSVLFESVNDAIRFKNS